MRKIRAPARPEAARLGQGASTRRRSSGARAARDGRRRRRAPSRRRGSLLDGRHQRLGDEPTAELTEPPRCVGLGNHELFSHRSSLSRSTWFTRFPCRTAATNAASLAGSLIPGRSRRPKRRRRPPACTPKPRSPRSGARVPPPRRAVASPGSEKGGSNPTFRRSPPRATRGPRRGGERPPATTRPLPANPGPLSRPATPERGRRGPSAGIVVVPLEGVGPHPGDDRLRLGDGAPRDDGDDAPGEAARLAERPRPLDAHAARRAGREVEADPVAPSASAVAEARPRA